MSNSDSIGFLQRVDIAVAVRTAKLAAEQLNSLLVQKPDATAPAGVRRLATAVETAVARARTDKASGQAHPELRALNAIAAARIALVGHPSMAEILKTRRHVMYMRRAECRRVSDLLYKLRTPQQ